MACQTRQSSSVGNNSIKKFVHRPFPRLRASYVYPADRRATAFRKNSFQGGLVGEHVYEVVIEGLEVADPES